MRKVKWMVILAVFWFLPSAVFAANTIDPEAEGVTITAIDTAWTLTDSYTGDEHAGGRKVNYIFFSPGAAGDICLIRNRNATGIILFRVKCADEYDDRTLPLDGDRVIPYLDLTEGAPNAAAILTIKFKD